MEVLSQSCFEILSRWRNKRVKRHREEENENEGERERGEEEGEGEGEGEKLQKESATTRLFPAIPVGASGGRPAVLLAKTKNEWEIPFPGKSSATSV